MRGSRHLAHLKNWRILTEFRTDPALATGLLRALFVLTNLSGIDRGPQTYMRRTDLTCG